VLRRAGRRYVARLLLLHGRWAYKRNSEVVLYAFYKNWAYTLLSMYLAFVTGGPPGCCCVVPPAL
jgi:magnesium-transporting ATPase (P-type)